MTDITYPSGVDAFQTLASAVSITSTATAVGSIGLGTGAPGAQAWARGVVFHVEVSALDALSVAYEVSDDGTNWYRMEAWDVTLSGLGATENMRLHVEPFVYKVLNVRILLSTSTSPADGTVTVKARLTGAHKPVTLS